MIAFKIDLKKVYDRVDWRFLKAILVSFDFLDPIIKLIMFYVTSSSLSLLWNGVKLLAFTPTWGLRQGDPMSPYLFILCMEGLSSLIRAKVDSGLWKSIQVGRGARISHLPFANDVLLFSKASDSQVRLVGETLDIFCKASGLKVNTFKSKAV